MICDRMRSGRITGIVTQMWRITPGPSRSASTTDSPGCRVLLGAPLRPPWAVPPAPRAPVGFSKVAARESIVGSMKAGFRIWLSSVMFWHGDTARNRFQL